MTRTIPAGSVDLVVWAEGSTGSTNADPILVADVADAIGDEAARIGAYLLVGGDRILSDSEWINANVLFDREGEIVGEYRKRQPVPFGEYVPFRSFLAPLIPELSQVPRHDQGRGPGGVRGRLRDARLGRFMGGVFRQVPRDVARNGAQLLVVATNNASYQVSPASDQLIGMTRMRRRARARRSPRRGDRQVDAHHRRWRGGERTPIYQQALLVGEVQMRDAGPTLYTRVGDWLQVAAAMGLVVALVRRRPAFPEATEEVSRPATLLAPAERRSVFRLRCAPSKLWSADSQWEDIAMTQAIENLLREERSFPRRPSSPLRPTPSRGSTMTPSRTSPPSGSTRPWSG